MTNFMLFFSLLQVPDNLCVCVFLVCVSFFSGYEFSETSLYNDINFVYIISANF